MVKKPKHRNRDRDRADPACGISRRRSPSNHQKETGTSHKNYTRQQQTKYHDVLKQTKETKTQPTNDFHI